MIASATLSAWVPVVKQSGVQRARHNSYRVKKPGQHGIRHDAPATIKLVNPVLTRDNTRIAALLKTS